MLRDEALKGHADTSTGVGKSRFTVVWRRISLFLHYYLLLSIVLFICITPVNLLLSTPAYRG